jgi:adenylate kinase family enzyme
LSGSGKRSIAKFIERDFKLVLINVDDYIVPNFDKTEVLSNNVKIINWDDIDAYDWEKINNKVLENQSKGVILCGPYFPTTKLKFESDFHIQIKVQKQVLIEKRLKYAESHESKFKGLEAYISMIVNQITYPNFLKYSEESKIDKYVNSKEQTNDQIYDQVADFLFFKIKENLQEKHKNRGINRPETKNVVSDDDDDDEFNYSDNSSTTYDDSDTSDILKKSEESIKLRSPEPIFVGSDDDVEVDYWEYPRVGGK